MKYLIYFIPLLLLFSCSKEEEKLPDESLVKIEALVAEGNLEQALSEVNLLIEKDQLNANYYRLRGEINDQLVSPETDSTLTEEVEFASNEKPDPASTSTSKKSRSQNQTEQVDNFSANQYEDIDDLYQTKKTDNQPVSNNEPNNNTAQFAAKTYSPAVSNTPAKTTGAYQVVQANEPSQVNKEKKNKLDNLECPTPKRLTDAQLNARQDLTVIKGIGETEQELLYQSGYTSYAKLSNTDVDILQKIIASQNQDGSTNPITWPLQAKMAFNNEWDKLKKIQEGIPN